MSLCKITWVGYKLSFRYIRGNVDMILKSVRTMDRTPDTHEVLLPTQLIVIISKTYQYPIDSGLKHTLLHFSIKV